jgi:phenylacetate-coenzyme A ligase PaaK-like adenylate-forming protein
MTPMPAFDFVHHDDGSATLVDVGGETARRLGALFRRLEARSSHYAALLCAADGSDPVARLGAMPATDKATYRTTLAREALAGLGNENFVIDLSSGSTSRPVGRFCRTADDLSEQAATERAFRRAGIGRGDRVVFADVGAAQIYDFYGRAARALGAADVAYLHMTADLDATLAALRKLHPDVFLTIPSLLARAGNRLGAVWSRENSPLRCLISTGEAMPASQRAAIEGAWGCRVMSLYGTTETGCLASECVCEDGHHFDVDAHVLTLRHAQRLGPDTLEGELLMTTVEMYTHAVVKYAVGDMVRVSLAPCPCGDPAPRVWHLRRVQDAFVFAGEKFHHGMILDALRAVAPELDSLTLEIDEPPEGPEQVALRAVIPEVFHARRHELRQMLREGIFELDSLVRARLVAVDVVCRPPANGTGQTRKTPRVIDRRAAASRGASA